MRILIYGLNFSPECTGIGKYTGEMAEWLEGRGHEIRVVAAPPYYPEWKIAAGYSAWRYRNERRVTRCPVWVPRTPSGLRRVFHLASFALASLPVMVARTMWRPHVVWVVEPTLFCFPNALLTAWLSGAKSWLHIQDFEVDAAFELGLLSSNKLRRLVERAESWLMRRFDRVSTISPNMAHQLARKNVALDVVRLFPNWVDTDSIRPTATRSSFRTELGLSIGVVVALYSGSMGNKQGMEVLVDAARLLQDRDDLRFVLCGNGAGRDEVVAKTAGLRNVILLETQPTERLGDLLNLADIHLLPQRADAADLVMPSKLTGMFASGRPVVATANAGTQLAETIAGKGLVVVPGDADGLAIAISSLADAPSLRTQMGAAAREYALAHMGKEAILTGFERSLLELAPTWSAPKNQQDRDKH